MKTEKEKMIAGELYFAEDPELIADRKFAREQMKIINQAENNEVRSQLLQETFGGVAGKIMMEPAIHFDYGYNIFIGKNFYANFNTTLLDVCPITIGDNCLFGPNTQLLTATHSLNPVKRNSGLESGKPITLGDNVWLGGGVLLCPGVMLGDNVVVAAGSVVTKSFPADVVIGGNPAQVIKTLNETPVSDLTAIRQKIDQIDSELVTLLEKRMAAVNEVVAFKQANQKGVLDTKREEQVLAKIRQNVQNPEFTETIVGNFVDIMRRSRDYQNQKTGGERDGGN